MIGSRASACLAKPRSVGWEPSTVASPPAEEVAGRGQAVHAASSVAPVIAAPADPPAASPAQQRRKEDALEGTRASRLVPRGCGRTERGARPSRRVPQRRARDAYARPAASARPHRRQATPLHGDVRGPNQWAPELVVLRRRAWTETGARPLSGGVRATPVEGLRRPRARQGAGADPSGCAEEGGRREMAPPIRLGRELKRRGRGRGAAVRGGPRRARVDARGLSSRVDAGARGRGRGGGRPSQRPADGGRSAQAKTGRLERAAQRERAWSRGAGERLRQPKGLRAGRESGGSVCDGRCAATWRTGRPPWLLPGGGSGRWWGVSAQTRDSWNQHKK